MEDQPSERYMEFVEGDRRRGLQYCFQDALFGVPRGGSSEEDCQKSSDLGVFGEGGVIHEGGAELRHDVPSMRLSCCD